MDEPAVDDLEVREATPADLDSLMGLLRQLHPDDPGPGALGKTRLAEISGQPGRSLLVATRHGRAVGTADLVVLPNITHGGQPWALVQNVVVDETARSAGVGEAMMREVLRRAAEAGCYKVELTSLAHRKRAHAFYSRLGFEPLAVGFRRYAEGHRPTSQGE